MRRKLILLAALGAAMTLLLTGCFVKTVDELYTLPRHSDEYNRLEDAIEEVRSAAGASYAAPVSGINQQPVQLADLDGDGQEEVVVFLRTSGDTPLKACIFSQVDGEYRLIDTIEGSGANFASVEYARLTGRGTEIVIGRQVSNSVLQSMSVYAYQDGHVVELMSANFSEYRTADLDGDGLTDIFVLRFDAGQRQGVAELYRWQDGQMEREPEVSLSAGASEVKRILIGGLTENVPAAFVASADEEGGLVTDVFAFDGSAFRNITAGESGVSTRTVRSYFVYAADVDEDGCIELPEVAVLPAHDTGTDERFSVISWYNLDLHGQASPKLLTYHSFSDGWFVVIPDAWRTQLCISRSAEVAGVRGYEFSHWQDGQTPEPIFTIYAFSGEDRAQTASADGRFVLAEKADVTYAAKLGTCVWANALSQDDLRDMFRFIHIDWNSGET